MTETVKPRRRYSSPCRQLHAEQTRREIIDAAGRLFRAQGYGAAMTAIAAEANVAVETVYRIFGTKTGLFRAVIEALLAGGTARAEVPVAERPAIRAIHDEPDPHRKVALYAATQPGIHRRAGPLLRALRDAKAADPELARSWDELEAWRFAGQGRFVAALDAAVGLPRNLSLETATDIVWALCSLAVYDHFVVDRGWSDDRYAAWLANALTRELVAD